MANCYITLNGTVIYPELPVGREVVAIIEDRRMANGQLRRAYRGQKARYTLTLRDATEAERWAWLTAARLDQSIVVVDELAATRTMLVMSVRDDLVRTIPAVEGGASTTGPAFYDLEIVAEEV